MHPTEQLHLCLLNYTHSPCPQTTQYLGRVLGPDYNLFTAGGQHAPGGPLNNSLRNRLSWYSLECSGTFPALHLPSFPFPGSQVLPELADY